MGAEHQHELTARSLRRATLVEIIFLVISGFFLFTEHRAHYLGILPYALLLVAFNAFLWLRAGRRAARTDDVPHTEERR